MALLITGGAGYIGSHTCIELLKLNFVTMVEYESNLPVKVAFPPVALEGGLGQILSQHKLKQLRIAETEK